VARVSLDPSCRARCEEVFFSVKGYLLRTNIIPHFCSEREAAEASFRSAEGGGPEVDEAVPKGELLKKETVTRATRPLTLRTGLTENSPLTRKRRAIAQRTRS
jgi:hypothetical protein